MAVIESKRSVFLAQPRAHKPRKSAKPTKLPASLRSTVTQRGKTTIRRFPGRTFHRFAEAKGKQLDYIEFFTMGEFHCFDVAFEDKTAMQFVIEPTFTLETDYADWKTGDWRPIKKWPLIHSQTNRP
ncbi:MAG: hypothetical protein LAO78_03345 [Acidobacteriia bacterium]|nr:hypothetical protein [Terriglobia bacterium]